MVGWANWHAPESAVFLLADKHRVVVKGREAWSAVEHAAGVDQ
jgi:hypothetical protein